jgi:hypothetical protein
VNQENILKLLSILQVDKIRIGGNGWVHSSCPLSKWTHPTGKDDHPSFGILVNNDDTSGFKCHSCQSHGSLSDLSFKLNKLSNWSCKDAVYFVQKFDQPSLETMERILSGAKPMWKEASKVIHGVTLSPAEAKRIGDTEENITNQGEVLAKLAHPLPDDVMKYLTDPRIPIKDRIDDYSPRGLTRETVAKFELSWDPKYNRILIPVKNQEGKVVGITGRAFYKKTKPKFLHYTGFKKELYLFNEYLSTKGGTGFVMEGHFDAIFLHQSGYTSSVAVMGSDVSQLQLIKLCKMFKELVYVRDGDAAGKKAEEKFRKTCSGHIKVSGIEIPDGLDPDDLSEEERIKLLGKPPQEEYPF